MQEPMGAILIKPPYIEPVPKSKIGGEMTWYLRILSALPEDPVAHSYL